jgi:hypothetical protein
MPFPKPVLATHAESHQEHTIRRTEGEATGAPLPYHLRSSLVREADHNRIRRLVAEKRERTSKGR